jgi:hypothetical protein
VWNASGSRGNEERCESRSDTNRAGSPADHATDPEPVADSRASASGSPLPI